MNIADKLKYADARAFSAAAITADDDNDLPSVASGIYVGGDGDLKCTLLGMADGTFVIFKGLTAGMLLPIVVKRVWEATTATELLALS